MFNERCSKAVILAGGRGTRVRHLLNGMPKPMAPAAGKPFVEWVARFLVRQGVNDITISIGFRGDAIADYFDKISLPGVTIRCEREMEEAGTAGGFVHAVKSRVDEPGGWIVSNGDSLILADIASMFCHLEGGTRVVILGLRAEDCSRFGRLTTDSKGHLLRFSEKHPGPGLINAGLYVLSAELVRELPSRRPLSFETEVFPALLEGGEQIKILSTTAPFIDIGTDKTFLLADEFIATNREHFL
jgi:D-glycero-alpha-D-manno-heptose 1-phosphate guanylyltransferase